MLNDALLSALPAQPDAPHPQATAALQGRMLQLGVEGYAAMRLDWSRTRKVLSSVQRDGRSLGSDRRRFLGDVLTFLARRERTLAWALEQAGLSARASRSQVERFRYAAAVALFGGLDPQSVSALPAGVDWDAVLDLRHTVTGWLRLSSPGPSEALGVCASLPDWMVTRLLDRGEEPVRLAAALNERAPLSLRVHPHGVGRDELLASISGASPSPLCEHAVILERHVDAFSLPEVRQGQAEVQDVGSQLIAEFCDVAGGQKVFDVCAGALGKSIALAGLMDDAGKILATDPRKDALDRGRKRLQRAGLRSVRTLPEAQVAGQADRVLIDAPCSGSGALRRRPWARWLITPRDVDEVVRTQGELLMKWAPRVAPGGRLIYATCSLFEEENEAIVERFCTEQPEWEVLSSSRFLGQERAEQIGDGRCLKLWPHRHGTDGFFAAALVRKREQT